MGSYAELIAFKFKISMDKHFHSIQNLIDMISNYKFKENR